VVAADHSFLVDSDLEDVVRVLLIALDHGEDAQGLPFLLLGDLRLHPIGRDVRRLGSVVRGRGDRVAVVVDLVALIDDGGAVVVHHGVLGVTTEAGARGVGGIPPVSPRPPRGRAPGTGVSAIPARVEVVVAGEVPTDVPALGPQRRRAAVAGKVTGL